MKPVKSLEDIVATLLVVNKAYDKRPSKLTPVSSKNNIVIEEQRDIPTREVIANEFSITEDAANRRILNLVKKHLLELDPERSFQGYKAYQKVYRLTGKGLQLLMINS